MPRSRTHTVLLGTAVAALAIGALAACGAEGPTVTINATPDTTSSTTTSRPRGQVDVLVTVRGARMHLHCEGRGDDASPTTWLAGLCSVTDDGTEMANVLQDSCADQSDPARNPERLDAPTAFDELASIDTLDDLPMIVVTAVDRDLPGLGAAETARLTRIWDAGQARWAGLSTASELVPVDDVSHYLHLDRPDIVLNLAQQLLD